MRMSEPLDPRDMQTLAELCRARIRHMSDIPIVLNDHTLGSEDLFRIAGLIAHADSDHLRPIGVICDLSGDGWLLLIAGIASGRPVVALDPFANRDLLAARMTAADCCGIVADASSRDLAASFGMPIVDLEAPCDLPLDEPAPDDPCLICFTSGSTGLPKCHARTQGGQLAVALSRLARRELRGPEHQILICMSPAFIGVLNNLAENLAAMGAIAVLPARRVTPERILEVIDHFQIRILSLVPTLLRQLVQALENRPFPSSVRMINLSGELMTCSDLRVWNRVLPEELSLCVSYGSTESGTITMHVPKSHELEGHGPVPLGRPVDSVQMVIVDEEDVPVADGTLGSIMIQNPGLALPFPSSEESVLRDLPGQEGSWFPMGDQGLINGSGNLVVMGRIDGEVKIDGIRFDPIACESSIRSVDGVADAVLVLVDHLKRTRAVAFAVAGPEQLAGIREAARSSGAAGDRVRIELCEVLPQLMTAKADRKALQKKATGLLDGSIPPAHSIQPRSRIENAIQDVWINHLKIPLPSVDRTFIELGGNSLQFLTVLIDLKQRYGFEFPEDRIATLDTIEQLAEAASVTNDPVNTIDPMVRFRDDDSARTAVLILPGLGGHVWAFRPLAEALGDAYHIGGLDWCKLASVSEMVRHVLDWVGDRELVVVGFSAGSRPAGKLVHDLEAIGRAPVRLVILGGVPRDRPLQRIRNYLSCRLRRPPEGNSAVDDYLFNFRMKGVRFYEQLFFSALQTPIHLLSTNEEEAGLLDRWKPFGEVSLHTSSVPHLGLVKHPIPQLVVDLIQGNANG